MIIIFLFPDKDRDTQIQVICFGNLSKLVSIFYCNMVFLSQWYIEVAKWNKTTHSYLQRPVTTIYFWESTLREYCKTKGEVD